MTLERPIVFSISTKTTSLKEREWTSCVHCVILAVIQSFTWPEIRKYRQRLVSAIYNLFYRVYDFFLISKTDVN